MKYLQQLLEFLSIRPYKTNTLDTGCYVDHYRNGKLIANKRVKRNDGR